MKIVSLFSGAGGLDRGFERAGFKVAWSNEFDRSIWATYRRNFPKTQLDARSIVELRDEDIPDCDGIIGGPPCQSWSEAGNRQGFNDARGKLFDEYLRVLRDKKPLFFLAENVPGITFQRNSDAFSRILRRFAGIGYNVTTCLVNSNDYGVPQNRQRVVIVGYLAQYGKHFSPPSHTSRVLSLKDAIWDLRKGAVPALTGNRRNPQARFPNHEFYVGDFSPIFMSRNRVRPWDKPSFTIQASGRHAPLHPQSPPMVIVGKDVRRFVTGAEYRRLSVRECARIQTFPDDHVFDYELVADGYKMIGNAVPVALAHAFAQQIRRDLRLFERECRNLYVRGTVLKVES